jgi:hypothetical protein
VHEHFASKTFVFRTDVESDYASMDHDILLAMLGRQVPDGRVLDLLRPYVRRTINDSRLYEDIERRISLGCPLSPLMRALYLKPPDERVEETGLANARFMDDGVILAPIRWKHREAIRLVNQTPAELHVEQHPRQDVHRADQPGVRLPGICIPIGGAGGRPADDRTVRPTGAPAL